MLLEFGNICGTDTVRVNGRSQNTSSAWDLINSGDYSGFAQSGIVLQYGVGCWTYFAEQISASTGDNWVTGACVTQGTTHDVWQQTLIVGGDYHIRSNVDSYAMLTSNFNPFLAWSFPFGVQIYGETHHDASDVPGYTPQPTDFSSIAVEDLYSNIYYDACGYVDFAWDTALRYSTTAPSCDHIKIWTSG